MEVKVVATETAHYVVQAAPADGGSSDIWLAGWIGIAGAVLGSIIGAVVSGWITKRARIDEQNERIKANTLAVSLKLERIAQATKFLHGEFAEARRIAAERNMTHVSKALRPVVQDLPTIHFTTDELAAVFAINRSGVVPNNFRILDDQHNAISAGVTKLWREKEAQQATVDGELDGDILVRELTPEELRRENLRAGLWDSVIDQLTPHITQTFDDAAAALGGIYIARGKTFRTNAYVDVPMLDGTVNRYIAWPDGMPLTPWERVIKWVRSIGERFDGRKQPREEDAGAEPPVEDGEEQGEGRQ